VPKSPLLPSYDRRWYLPSYRNHFQRRYRYVVAIIRIPSWPNSSRARIEPPIVSYIGRYFVGDLARHVREWRIRRVVDGRRTCAGDLPAASSHHPCAFSFLSDPLRGRHTIRRCLWPKGTYLNFSQPTRQKCYWYFSRHHVLRVLAVRPQKSQCTRLQAC